MPVRHWEEDFNKLPFEVNNAYPYSSASQNFHAQSSSSVAAMPSAAFPPGSPAFDPRQRRRLPLGGPASSLSAFSKDVSWFEAPDNSPPSASSHLSALNKNCAWLDEPDTTPPSERADPPRAEESSYGSRLMSGWQPRDMPDFLKTALSKDGLSLCNLDISRFRNISAQQMMNMDEREFEELSPGMGHLIYKLVQGHKKYENRQRGMYCVDLGIIYVFRLDTMILFRK